MEKQKINFIGIQFIAYFSFALCMSNLTPYMASLGYDAFQRSIALSGYALMNILLQFLIGILADKYQTMRKITIISMLLFGVFSGVLFITKISSLTYLILVVAIVGGVLNSLCGSIDTWIMGTSKALVEQLPLLKSFGSIGWTIGSLFSTYLLSVSGYRVLGVTILCLSIVVMLMMRCTDDIVPVKTKAVTTREYQQLIRNKSYIQLIGALFLLYGLVVVNTGLVVDKMLAIQATDFEISLKWAMGSLLEIPMYVFMTLLLKKVRDIQLLKFSSLVLVIQFIGFSLAQTGMQIVFLSALQIFTTPIILVSSKNIIVHLIEKPLKQSGQLIALSVYMGGASLLFPIISGMLSRIFSYNNVLMLYSTIGIVGYFMLQNLARNNSTLSTLKVIHSENE